MKAVTFKSLNRKEVVVDGQPVAVVEAIGSCGFNTEKTVEVAHLKGVAVFVFENVLSTPEAPRFTSIATGLAYCQTDSRESAWVEGVRSARRSANVRTDREVRYRDLQAMAMAPRVVEAVDVVEAC